MPDDQPAEELAGRRCKPCEGGVPALGREQAEKFLRLLPGWTLSGDARAIRRAYKFKNFRQVIGFFNKIAEAAEAENHHPDLKIGYSRVEVELSTHALKGLSENDFILAAKFDACQA